MSKTKVINSSGTTRRIRPALSPEARENQLAALAVDLAEKQLLEGTASSQVITHYLKIASVQGQLEKERLKEENKLLRAKTEAIESTKRSEELMKEAINAFRSYSGHSEGDTDEH